MTKQEFDEAYDNGYKHGYATGTSELDVLDKIYAEINGILTNAYDEGVKEKALDIIDKYRGESEDKE